MSIPFCIRAGRPAFLAFGTMAILGLTVFALAAYLSLGNQLESRTGTSLTQALLGEARVMLGDRLYKQADIYFHRGLDYKTPENRLSDSWITRIREKVNPSEHAHAAGKTQIREIMPWLELTMRVNPEHLESVLVAAYWLGRHLERPDLAEQLLLRAQRQTPFAYAVQLEKAKLYLHEGRRPQARTALNAALAFWERTGNPDDEGDRLALAEALLLRGVLQETAGQLGAAAADYRAILDLFPQRANIRQRLNTIAQGIAPDPPAEALLAIVTKHDDQAHHCEQAHEAHVHH